MTALPPCPHCFAPVRGDGRPTCLCAAVDAEDFDPLRIRPYVSLPGDDGAPGEGAGEDGAVGRDMRWAAGEAYRTTGIRRGDHLDDLPGVDAAVHRADTADTTDRAAAYETYRTGSPPGGPRGAPEPFPVPPLPVEPLPFEPLAVEPLRVEPPPLQRFPASAGAPEPLIPRARRHSGPSSRTFSSATDEPSARPSAARASAPSRRRRGLPAVLVAAGTAVAATAVMIGTDVLSGGRQDRAAPPDGGAPSPTATSPSSDEPAPTDSGSPSARATPSSPAPDATHFGTPEATVKLYRTAESHPPAPTRAAGTVIDSPGSPGPSTAPAPVPTGPIVLREGSSGPEVAELQARLRQLALYADTANGRYDADVRAAVSRYQRSYGVQGDPDGVYGARTRASLEARTQEP
ncbi:peptidoglycan-binding protein [Streptomyces lydicus]|uniref:peptidoglycan-binding domain-containing protein n=1 Tax=Streptomyces lydicus TaxID=47763 RepID=UPI00379ACC9B